MKRNMKQWIQEMIAADVKTPMPVLSFPAVQLMGVSVRELISDAGLQAEGTTEVEQIHHIERGYADLVGDLRALGAEIRLREA